MLIEFKLENFLSFKQPTLFSLEAGPDKSLQENNIISPISGSRYQLLASSAVYGPNSSGKSNLLKAFAFMRNLVRRSATSEGPEVEIPATPFRLHYETISAPSSFEALFWAEDRLYCYGLCVDRRKVYEEWLYEYNAQRKKVLFERRENFFQFGRSWQRGDWNPEVMGAHTLPNVLFLSYAAKENHPQALKVRRWFVDKNLVIFDPAFDTPADYSTLSLSEDPTGRETILSFLRGSGLDIEDFRLAGSPRATIQVEDMSERQAWEDRPPKPLFGRKAILPEGKERIEWFDLREESRGTQRVFALIGLLGRVLERGDCLWLDELEPSLHPMLCRALLKLFHNKQTNPHGAQLVFTTHSLELLDSDLLRRDQVWLTEKNPGGDTRLYSLLDFTPPHAKYQDWVVDEINPEDESLYSLLSHRTSREAASKMCLVEEVPNQSKKRRLYRVLQKAQRQGENLRKSYLSGRYGAVPEMGELIPPEPEATPAIGRLQIKHIKKEQAQ